MCTVTEHASSAILRGQAQLGRHLAAVYPHAQLSRFYTWFYLYVTHVRSVPRRSAFSSCKRKTAGTAEFEATPTVHIILKHHASDNTAFKMITIISLLHSPSSSMCTDVHIPHGRFLEYLVAFFTLGAHPTSFLSTVTTECMPTAFLQEMVLYTIPMLSTRTYVL